MLGSVKFGKKMITSAMLLSTLAFCNTSVNARQLSPREALENAVGKTETSRLLSRSAKSATTTSLAYTVETEGTPIVYVFTRKKRRLLGCCRKRRCAQRSARLHRHRFVCKRGYPSEHRLGARAVRRPDSIRRRSGRADRRQRGGRHEPSRRGSDCHDTMGPDRCL